MGSGLHEIIDAPCGMKILVNPGTGPVEGAKEEEAGKNIMELVKDVGLEEISFERDASKDSGDGRYTYRLKCNQTEVEVYMPGWPLKRVRFLGEENQKIMDFPRLTIVKVDSNDYGEFVWKYATGYIRDIFKKP